MVTWGAMVERCELAAKKIGESRGESIEIIDLRTISPWDRQAVLDSVARTRRCLIVHEDGMTAGFGARDRGGRRAARVFQSRCADSASGDSRRSGAA